MGGEGPYVDFTPEERAFWASHTGLVALDDDELSATYERAHTFLMECKEQLVKEHGWEDYVDDKRLLFSVSTLDTHRYIGGNLPRRIELFLPATFTSFLDPAESGTWGDLFQRHSISEAKRPSKLDNDLFISGLAPISDIFYLLQCIAPGMLPIIRIDEIDDAGEVKCTRLLPRSAWIKEHEPMLEYVLGSKEAYLALLSASRENSKAFKSNEWISRWDPYDDHNSDERGASDYTACSLECGYCGRCDY